MFYKLKEVVEKKKRYARSEKILDVGTQLHEWVQREVLMKIDEIKDHPLKLIPLTELPTYAEPGIEWIKEHNAPPTEIKFVDSRWTQVYPISAMVDGAFSFLSKDVLFEFKTINPTDYATLIEPLNDHIKQGAIYSLGTGVRWVVFLYLCKGTQQWKAFLVQFEDKHDDWVKARIQQIEQYVVDDILPPAEIDSNCNFCGFKYLCDKDLKA